MTPLKYGNGSFLNIGKILHVYKYFKGLVALIGGKWTSIWLHLWQLSRQLNIRNEYMSLTSSVMCSVPALSFTLWFKSIWYAFSMNLRSFSHLFNSTQAAWEAYPQVAPEDLQLVALSDCNRPPGADSPWRNLRYHWSRSNSSSGQTQSESNRPLHVGKAWTAPLLTDEYDCGLSIVCFCSEASEEEDSIPQ